MSNSTEWEPSLWRETFEELLDDDNNELDFGDQWNLNFNYRQTDSVTNEERRRGWKICCHSARGHFQCESCGNTWSSARVTVLFRYRLRGERGTVIMRPFGQACRSCQDDAFQRCGFSKKEVEEALLRLCSRIRKNCYGEEDDYDGSSASTKRGGKPHEAELCEACQDGICSLKDDVECV